MILRHLASVLGRCAALAQAWRAQCLPVRALRAPQLISVPLIPNELRSAGQSNTFALVLYGFHCT